VARHLRHSCVAPHRDVEAFEARAPGYDQGWLGRLHHEIAEGTARLAATLVPEARRVLDVGCGTGYLLRLLAVRLPDAGDLAGIDAAPSMIATATDAGHDERIRLAVGVAEALPYPDGSFDLVVSTTSFDHWADQLAGLRQCARVLVPGGRLVLVDQLSPLLLPTLVWRRGKARTPRRAERLLRAAGFESLAWHRVYAGIINAVTATTSP